MDIFGSPNSTRVEVLEPEPEMILISLWSHPADGGLAVGYCYFPLSRRLSLKPGDQHCLTNSKIHSLTAVAKEYKQLAQRSSVHLYTSPHQGADKKTAYLNLIQCKRSGHLL